MRKLLLIQTKIISPNLCGVPGGVSMLVFGFIWGVATSAYQIDGGWQAGSKGESIWDRFAHTPAKIIDHSNGDVACDHYHRWREDILLMKELGVGAYRFSVSWPRIFQRGKGKLNLAGLDFYEQLVDGLLDTLIIPFITLYHWELSQTLQDEGGWPSRSTAAAFVELADVVTRRLGDRVKYLDPLFGRGYQCDMIGEHTKEKGLPVGMDFIQPGDRENICIPCDFLGVNY